MLAMSQQQSKSDLDQALSRKRSSSIWGPPFGVVFARRASPRSSPSTLPGTASAVLASPPGNGFCFRFFVKIFKRLFVRIRPYQSRSINTRNIVGQQEDLCQWNLRVSDFYLWRHFFFVCWFHFFFLAPCIYHQCKSRYDEDWGVVWAIEQSVL